jgi:hypothetical protein
MSEGEEKPVTNQVTGPSDSLERVTSQQLEDAGLSMPLADPAALRAAFAQRQRMLLSVCDPNRDFLYVIRYVDIDGKPKSRYETNYDAAKELHRVLGGDLGAYPKKSGCMKIAHALGIQTNVVSREGLPADPRAVHSFCTVRAVHKRTGRQEEGQGYCDRDEKRFAYAEKHAIISMAETRAYCHAVLRCAGFDSVSADAIVVEESPEETVSITTTMPVERERPAVTSLPAPSATVADLLGTTATPQRQEQPVSAPAQAAAATTTPATTTTPAATATTPASSSDDRRGLVTKSMAKIISDLLMQKLGSKERARDWLREAAGVERSVDIREDAYGGLKEKLEALTSPADSKEES